MFASGAIRSSLLALRRNVRRICVVTGNDERKIWNATPIAHGVITRSASDQIAPGTLWLSDDGVERGLDQLQSPGDGQRAAI